MAETDPALEQALDLFHLLASEPRLKLLKQLHLASRPLAAADLARSIDASRSAASYHLSALQEHGLVRATHRGSYRLYTLSKLPVHRRLQVLFPHIFPESGGRDVGWRARHEGRGG